MAKQSTGSPLPTFAGPTELTGGEAESAAAIGDSKSRLNVGGLSMGNFKGSGFSLKTLIPIAIGAGVLLLVLGARKVR